MTFVVEMARGEPHTPEHAIFSCGSASWVGLLALAQAHGWIPAGTEPDEQAARSCQDYLSTFDSSYAPEEWLYCKRISDVDATNLALALSRALAHIRSIPHVDILLPASHLLKDEMSDVEAQRVNWPPTELLATFCDFVSGGGFAFAWDD